MNNYDIIIKGNDSILLDVDDNNLRRRSIGPKLFEKLKYFEDNPNTRQGGEIRHALTGISPYYKSGVEQTQAEHRYGSSSNLEYQTADYKVKEKQEHSRMKIIDPHVNSNSNIPASKTFKPTNLLGDFPSQHTHKSFMKVDPLEQKRFKSLERMPVTTTTYLAESVGRHREMEASKLRNYLKTNENDASKLWDKPDWPGHKQEDTENLKELERMKLAIESLSKEVIQTKTRSMNDLSRPPPSTKPKVNTEGSSRSRNQDPGWLIRMRTNKYLQNAAATASGGDRSRAMSADNLNRSSSRMSFASELTNADDALKGLPDKDKEKRTTTFETHQEIRQHSSTSQQTQNQQRGSSVPRLPIQRSDSVNPDNANRVNYQGSPLVLPEPTTPPTIQSSTPIAIQPTQPRHEFHDRLMSPTFDRQSSHQTPKPILKQNYKSASQLSEQETGYCYQHYQEAHVHQSNVVTEPNDRSLNKHNMTRPLVDNSKQPQFNGLRSKSPLENNSNNSNAPQNTQRTHRLQSHSPQPRSVSTTFEMLDEEERMRIMQENLRKHRQRNPQNIPKKTQRYPTAPYNGPFFELEEVSRQTTTPSILKNNENYQQKYQSQEMHHYQEQHQSMNKEMSSSEMELHRATNYSDFGNPNNPMQNNGVVIWPPIQPKTEKEISRPPSAMAKSMLDPERRAEFERQRHQEYEAMRQREEEKRISMEKQMKAIIIQQEKLSEQQHVMQSEVRSHSVRPHVGQNYQPINVDSDMQSSMHEVYNNVPSQGNHIRIYETRPISVMSTDQHSPGDNDLSPNNNATWKRTYVLDSNESRSVEKNEIVSSEELLEKEQYEIDILKRRSAFVEKPTQPPPIQRLGKRWQPPAEEPYIWPQLRKPLLIDADHPVSGSMYSPGNDDGEEYRWAPLISDPHYRKENKNFTPEQSPPSSPRRFLQMQTLDEVNRRQTKNVIRPSPDGSHRPLPMFKAIRNTPSGGFYPHAPNAIKVVKKRLHQSHSNINAEDYYTGEEDVQIIHERNFHGVDGRRSATTMGRSQSVHDLGKDDEINDWDKIYDLPAHSSTITGNDVPHNVNLRKRLAQFESQASLIHQKYAQQQERERRVSEATLLSSSSGGYHHQNNPSAGNSQHSGSSYSRKHPSTTPIIHHPSNNPTPVPQNAGLLRRVDSRNGPKTYHTSNQQLNIPPPPPQMMIPPVPVARPRTSVRQQHQRPHSVTPQMLSQEPISRRGSKFRESQPSPIPPSYNTARAFVPPPLPAGYRDVEFEEYMKLKQSLAARSNDRQKDFKLVGSDIIKTDPDPVPEYYKQEPIVREFTETYSRVMVRNADKHKNLHQEAVSRMEPVRSLKALPSPPSVRVPLPPKVLSPSLANNSEQHRNLSSTIIELKDDKPRGIIKPVVATKPRVTETIKRIEETKRTEEIERRVQRKEKKHRSHRYHHNDFHMSEGYYNGDNLAERRKVISEQEEEEIRRDATRLKNRHRSSSVAGSKKELREYHEKRHFTSQEMNDAVRSAYDAVDSNDMRQQQRSSSMNRQGMLPYYPSQENYNRSSTTRRGHSSQDGGYTQQHQQQYGRSGDFASNGYGSLSDSLRRGEVRYNPNGDVHEVYRNESRGHRRSSDAGMGMHKSFSTRDVYRDTGNYGTFHRNGNNQQPYIEFPPTLPRRQHPGEPPIPPPHRSASQIGLDSHYRPISKAHSYADWQHKGSNFGNFGRRHDGDMSRMENEFRDSLLIPTTNNGGVVNDREHRVEQIPGGFEEYDRKVQGNSGRRLNRDGIPTDFREASHEYSFKRETAH
uniref:Zds_C domain-containing protein n=1 Tax=Rhabditophanes sp. KR3021 TaxID=114890 RepID=A0AC35TTE3_9BILA